MKNRLAKRTLIFCALAVTAFFMTEPLTRMTGWPEIAKGMIAAGMLSWAEISIMWIRIFLTPNLDAQTTAILAHKDANPIACAITYGIYQLTWAVRLAAFLVLYGFL